MRTALLQLPHDEACLEALVSKRRDLSHSRAMRGAAPVGSSDEIAQMQSGVRRWVQQSAGHSKGGLSNIPPLILLSGLCASAFCPLLMIGGVAGAGLSILSTIGGGMLTQVVTDVVQRLGQHGQADTPSQDELEKAIAEQLQQIMATENEQARILRNEIASVLQEIEASKIALGAAVDQANERTRREVVAAIGVLGTDFAELEFLIADLSQSAARIQESLELENASVRTVIEQNNQQSTNIRLIRDDLAALVRTAADRSAGTGRDDGTAHWRRGCPYRGLAPFGESEAEVFYGRERLTAELAVKLTSQLGHGGLIVVTGASGTGKSSLLRAGLVPALARGEQVPGSDQWPRIVMTPTKSPLAELAVNLAALGGMDYAGIQDRLTQTPDQAHQVIWSAVLAAAARQQKGHSTPDNSARLMLIVDQFEQIFTLIPDPAEDSTREAFVTALCAAATNPVGPGHVPPALVVVAVRGDFWERCAAFPGLADALQHNQFVVGPMERSELSLTITGPAETARLSIDSALIDTILRDLRTAGGEEGAGALPLLSQAMALTWENREGNRLTSRGYSQAGGVSHAVQTGADKVYNGLPGSQQSLARELLLKMTVVSEDGKLARRPVTRNDLYAGLSDTDLSQVEDVLDAFAAQRLVVLDENTAQISHDILLHAWPKLRGWLKQDQASWILHSQLDDDASAWAHNGNDRSFLYRGPRLITAEQEVKRWSASPERSPKLTATQHDFLDASDRARRRTARQWRSFGALILAILLIVVWTVSRLTLRASSAEQSALAQRLATEANGLAGSQPDLALLLAVESARQGGPHPPWEASQALWTALTTQPGLQGYIETGFGGSTAISPDASTVLSIADDGCLRQETAPPAYRVRRVCLGTRPELVAYSGNGQYVVAVQPDGAVKVLGAMRLSPIWTAPAEPGGAQPPIPVASAVSGNGDVAAVQFGDGHIVTFRRNGSRVMQTVVRVPGNGPSYSVYSPALSLDSDGKTLLVATNPLSHLGGTLDAFRWDSNTYAPENGFDRARISAQSWSISPIGSSIFTADGNAVTTYDLLTGRKEKAFYSDISSIIAVAVSQSGRTVTALGFNEGVQRFDTRTGRSSGLQLRGLAANGTLRSGDSGTIAITSGERTSFWVSHPGAIQALTALPMPETTVAIEGRRETVPISVSGVALSPSGGEVLGWGLNGTYIWQVASGHVTRISAVNTVAAAFDGENRVAILDEKNGLVVVSLKPSITIVATVPAAVTGLTDGGGSATFGAGGHLLATIVNGKVDVWDVDAGALRYTLDVDEGVFSVQLAAGSDRLLTEGTTGIAVYSLLRGKPQPLYRSRGNFDKPTLSQGGDMVAWLDGDKPDQMDSVALAAPGATPGPKRSVQLSETHQGTGLNPTGIYSIAIDTQNNIAAAVREDGSVELRDLYSGSLIVSLPSSTNSSQSSAVPPHEIPGLYFSPNGDLLMETTSALNVMSANIRDWERDACALAGRDITDQEWADWVGGGRGHPCQGL